MEARTPEEATELYNKAEKSYNSSAAFGTIAVGIWVINIVDAYLSAESPGSTSSIDSTPNIGLSVSPSKNTDCSIALTFKW